MAALVALCGLVVALTTAPVLADGAAAQRTWHADQARVPDARAAGRSGDGVLVAVLDTWVDATHPDFESRVVTGADCSSGSCRTGTAPPDPCTHGTHVAGTVASSSYGVAPAARVLPVKVLRYEPPGPLADEGSCTGTTSSVAAGIRYAVQKGARVINLSLGTSVPGLSSATSITSAVDEAARAGAVVVFAAGNSSVPLSDSYGGNALIVAATGPSGRLASYSQRGLGVTLAAPGGEPAPGSGCTTSRCVTSLFPSNKYAVAAGTSMAAPHVSGIAALLFGQNPDRTRADVVQRLRSTARDVPGGGAGDGLVDARAALAGTAVRPASEPPPATAAPDPVPAASDPPARADGGTPRADDATTGAAPPADPVQPGELPADDGAAVEVAPQDPAAVPPTTTAVADAPDDGLPPGPPAVAVALVLAAALSTTLTGLRSSPRERRQDQDR